MNADEYQQAALRIEGHRRPLREEFAISRNRVLHAMIGLCTETGELQNVVKKELFYGKELDKTNVAEELQDCLWYIAIGLDALGIKMSEAMERNINKLRVRFPDKFSEEKALNRDLDAERKTLELEDTQSISRSEIDVRLEGRNITSVIRDYADGSGSFMRQLLWKAGQEIEQLRRTLELEQQVSARQLYDLVSLREKIIAWANANS